MIAFENSDDPGYVTEKIANAFLSGAVPVYWGTADVSKVFNPESFIHCGEFVSFEACADWVTEVQIDVKSNLCAPCSAVFVCLAWLMGKGWTGTAETGKQRIATIRSKPDGGMLQH